METYQELNHRKNHSSMLPDDNCKFCKMDQAGRENTQGLIDKDLLLEPTIEELQLKHKEAMHKFVIRRTG